MLRWPRLRNWPGKRLRESLCRDRVGELGRDLGMGRSIKMNVVPLIKIGGDLRVKDDDPDVACAQPFHHSRDVGCALLFRETKAKIVAEVGKRLGKGRAGGVHR